MAVPVYLLQASDQKELSVVQQTLADFYPTEVFSSEEKLEQALKQQSKAVVIFQAPAAKAGLKATRFRGVLSTVSCIAVLSQEEAEALPGYQFDSDFLLTPLTRFEILSRVSTAARQAELMTNLAASAQMDDVTQLYNRRYFMSRLNEEISLSKRHLSPLSCVILGFSFYQVYLDSYGYDFMTALLRHIAVAAESHVRQEDIIARVGDDEIGVLLPRSSEKGARTMAERMVKSLNQTVFEHGGAMEEITVHVGIVSYPLPDDSPADADTLVRYARHALHNARCQEDRHIQLFSEIRPVL